MTIPVQQLRHTDPFLDTQLSKISNTYFDGKIKANIFWGIPSTGNTDESCLHDNQMAPAASYEITGDTTSIIIHSFLRDRLTPQYVIRYLIHHECCHETIPPIENDPHSLAFQQLELQAPKRDKAIEWLKKVGFNTVDW